MHETSGHQEYHSLIPQNWFGSRNSKGIRYWQNDCISLDKTFKITLSIYSDLCIPRSEERLNQTSYNTLQTFINHKAGDCKAKREKTYWSKETYLQNFNRCISSNSSQILKE